MIRLSFGEKLSSQYAGGLTLRFARVKGYRPDKPAAQADTIETIRAMHRAATPPSADPV